jgi:predicted house-cleaning NTP pyrophosphatase (Maf/HAM1 superfamily)
MSDLILASASPRVELLEEYGFEFVVIPAAQIGGLRKPDLLSSLSNSKAKASDVASKAGGWSSLQILSWSLTSS